MSTIHELHARTSADKSQARLLREAIDTVITTDFADDKPAQSAPMPGEVFAGAKIEGPNHSIRVPHELRAWLFDVRQAFAPELAMRQFLGIALTRYLTPDE